MSALEPQILGLSNGACGELGASTSPPVSKIKRRSRKACHHCHARKIRCNVAECGIPCSNCVDADTQCIIRRRKNQRAGVSVTDGIPPSILPVQQQWPPMTDEEFRKRVSMPPVQTIPHHPAFHSAGAHAGWWDAKRSSHGSDRPEMPKYESASSHGGSIDVSHLMEIDDLMAMEPAFQPEPLPTPPVALALQERCEYSPLPRSASGPPPPATDCASVYRELLPYADFEYLYTQRCLELPPDPLLRRIMESYFLNVHPTLPCVAENEFWALWNGNEFRQGKYSLLLLRAMMFTAISYVDADLLSELDFRSKREARTTYYRLAKLIFDSFVEQDPLVNAQVCLLLSTRAMPNPNMPRWNSNWVTNAARFARVVRADRYFLCADPAKSALLKRLWWCVLFRDRSLALGLRRACEAPLCLRWTDETHILQPEDLRFELGHSPVHDERAQRQIFAAFAPMCRLIQAITPVLTLTYKWERLDQRLDNAWQSLPAHIADLAQAQAGLQKWHVAAAEQYPLPIHRGADTPPALTIFVHMMFLQYDNALLALHFHPLLLRECLPSHLNPPPATLPSASASRVGLEAAVDGVTARVRELVQAGPQIPRMLPIAATAFLVMPMFLQAVTVAAARGCQAREPGELAKLGTFRALLAAQRELFDGPDFCANLLIKVIGSAQADRMLASGLTPPVAPGQPPRPTASVSPPASSGAETATPTPPPPTSALPATGALPPKLDWGSLIHKRPRFLLRLVMYLDQSMCQVGQPIEEDFPPELRKGSAGA